MAAVDGNRRRPRWRHRRRRRRRRHRVSFQAGADPKCPLADGLYLGHVVADGEELRQEPARTTVGHPRAQFSHDALILDNATVRHGFSRRRERASRRNAATTGFEARRVHLDSPEQRNQPAGPDVLQRALLLAMRTAAAVPTIIRNLRLNEVALHARQDCFGIRQCQAKRRNIRWSTYRILLKMFDAPVGTPQIRPVRPPNNRLGAVRRRPREQHPGQSGQL